MIKAITLVGLVARLAAADSQLVATGRIGAAGYTNTDPDRDTTDLGGYGPSIGAELGLRLPAYFIEPAIAIDYGQFSATGSDYVFGGNYALHEHMVAVTARLRVAILPVLDLEAGVGETLFLDATDAPLPYGPMHDYHGELHEELGVGVKVWHDARQAIRVDVLARRSQYMRDIEVWSTQLGATVGYSFSF